MITLLLNIAATVIHAYVCTHTVCMYNSGLIIWCKKNVLRIDTMYFVYSVCFEIIAIKVCMNVLVYMTYWFLGLSL